jgi:RNA polymerase sigma-70 factor, ECF subfamily
VAFAAALQHLPPRQRAVLILRDALGLVRQGGLRVARDDCRIRQQRAPAGPQSRGRAAPRGGQQPTIGSLDGQRVGEIVQLFTDAFERGDVDATVGLLAEDATFAILRMAGSRGWIGLAGIVLPSLLYTSSQRCR